MGLSASSARIFLLTKQNNDYELMAQDISDERMVLAKEQEEIADEYSNATSNTVYVASVLTDRGATEKQTMGLDSIAKSQSSGTTNGTLIALGDANGQPFIAAQWVYDLDADGVTDINTGHMEYYTIADNETTGGPYRTDGKGTKPPANLSTLINNLNTNGQGTYIQNGIENGSLQLLVFDTNTENQNENSTDREITVDGNKGYFVRKTPDSLSGLSSRYYTEDDAAAQAHYQSEMTRVTALDTKLENKLNRIETQKKAVSKELESVEQLASDNVDRTFGYMNG